MPPLYPHLFIVDLKQRVIVDLDLHLCHCLNNRLYFSVSSIPNTQIHKLVLNLWSLAILSLTETIN
jgi:hypothetical protein